jgi:hypothetical protein
MPGMVILVTYLNITNQTLAWTIYEIIEITYKSP